MCACGYVCVRTSVRVLRCRGPHRTSAQGGLFNEERGCVVLPSAESLCSEKISGAGARPRFETRGDFDGPPHSHAVTSVLSANYNSSFLLARTLKRSIPGGQRLLRSTCLLPSFIVVIIEDWPSYRIVRIFKVREQPLSAFGLRLLA